MRSLFAVHPDLLAPALQISQWAIAKFLIDQTGIKRDQAATGTVTLIQRFGSAASDRYTENWRPYLTDRIGRSQYHSPLESWRSPNYAAR